MALKLKNIFATGSDQVAQTYTIESWHVSQSVDAFTGVVAYDITVSGSFTLTGSQYVSGSVSASFGPNTVGFHGTSSWSVSSSRSISSSFAISASYALSSSYAVSSSFATSASYALSSSFASTASNGVSNLGVGTFYDVTTQTVVTGASASITLNTPVISDGVTLVSNSQITVARTGTYNLQFSAQVQTTVGGGPTVYIWLRKNGIDIPNSNTGIAIQNQNQKYVGAWNFVENLIAGDYLELIWYVDGGASAQLIYEAAGAANGGVAVPSVIATMTQIK